MLPQTVLQGHSAFRVSPQLHREALARSEVGKRANPMSIVGQAEQTSSGELPVLHRRACARLGRHPHAVP